MFLVATEVEIDDEVETNAIATDEEGSKSEVDLTGPDPSLKEAGIYIEQANALKVSEIASKLTR